MAHDDIRVLRIDDDPHIAELTREYLEREDDAYAVETAASPEEGLRILGDRPPDCLVSNYNTPGMDGLEVLRAVREEYPELPFILFTGKGGEEVAARPGKPRRPGVGGDHVPDQRRCGDVEPETGEQQRREFAEPGLDADERTAEQNGQQHERGGTR